MSFRRTRGAIRLAAIAGLAAASFHCGLAEAEAQMETTPEARRGAPEAALVSPGVAPFGSVINQQRISGYHRATYLIGTAGSLSRDGVSEAKRVGFIAILDLQSSAARSSSERIMAEYAHVRYFNLPLNGLPTQQQLQQFAGIVQNRQNLPILVHGDSLDQVGAVWALYRANLGVPPQIAVVDGITAGLGPSTPAVRSRLGLPTSQ